MSHISEASRAEAPALTEGSTTLVRSIFSFPVMCMFLLSAVIFGFCVKQFAEPDLWWHFRNAQTMLEYHSFPRVDTYSFTAVGLSRPDFEWLSEIPYYLAFKAWGLQGALLLSLVVSVLIFAGIYYLCCRAGADCKDAVIGTLIAIGFGVVSIGPRMLLFGWLCMVVLLLLLEEYRRTGRGLWAIPLLFLVWISLHASWAFGMAVFAIFVLSGLVEGEWGLVVARRWSRSQLRNLILVGVASFALLFVNPFGYQLVLYPFEVGFRMPVAVQYIEEWRPLDLSTGNGKLTILVIFALLAAALLSRRKWRLDETLLLGFALWSGLSHGRFIFFVGFVVAPLLATRLHLFPPYERERDRPWLNAAIMAGVVTAICIVFPSAALLQQKVDREYPTEALHFMRQHQLNGRILNEFVWGGYMEWNAPELKPFIDGRADVFAASGVMEDHVKAMTLQQPMQILDRYHVDYALLQPNGPLGYVLGHSTAWHIVYSDPVSVLWGRDGNISSPKAAE